MPKYAVVFSDCQNKVNRFSCDELSRAIVFDRLHDAREYAHAFACRNVLRVTLGYDGHVTAYRVLKSREELGGCKKCNL